jgi:hypothetical protein
MLMDQEHKVFTLREMEVFPEIQRNVFIDRVSGMIYSEIIEKYELSGSHQLLTTLQRIY